MELLSNALAAALLLNSNGIAAQGDCWKSGPSPIEASNDMPSLRPPAFYASGSDWWSAWQRLDGLHTVHSRGSTWESGRTLDAWDPMIRSAANREPMLLRVTERGLVVAQWAERDWEDLGEPLEAFPRLYPHIDGGDMAVDSKGRPYVVWREGDEPQSNLFVSHWNGNTWDRLGGPIGGDVENFDTSIAIDETGAPWIAWVERERKSRILSVARWSGSEWTDVGAIREKKLFTTDGHPMIPSLIDSDGRMALLWGSVETRHSPVRLKGEDIVTANVLVEWTDGKWKALPPPLEASSGIWNGTMSAGKRSLFLTWSNHDEGGLVSVYSERLDAHGWHWVLRGAQFDSGQSDVDGVNAVASATNELRVLWFEPDADRRMKLWTVATHPCNRNETPGAFVRSKLLTDLWPKTVDEAVTRLMAELDDRSKQEIRSMPRDRVAGYLWIGFGTQIRNDFGLWAGNGPRLHDCRDGGAEPCSGIIIERLWDRLQLPAEPSPAPTVAP